MCPDPGTDPQGFHQDDGHYPLPRPRPTFIANTLIALDDFTKENGATRLVPFSHNWTAPVRQDVEFEYAEMEAGSLLVFDAHFGTREGVTERVKCVAVQSISILIFLGCDNRRISI